MKLIRTETGYRIKLTEGDTWEALARFPCAELRGERVIWEADSGGLVDLFSSAPENDVSLAELEALADYFLRGELRALWPLWETNTIKEGKQ
jgi:hypothetical protein